MNALSHLAYVKASRPTGKKIAQTLGVTSFGMKPPATGYLDVLIRWGSRVAMPQAQIEINPVGAISRASDKVRALEIMRNEGLNVVPFFTDYETLRANYGPRCTVLGRSRTGYGGKDIVVYHSGQRPTRHHDFYSVWIDTPREYRVHVVGEKVVRVQGKYLDYPDKAGDGFIRNYAHGYRFRAPKNELHYRRRNDAIAAVKALGLHFGAVDMLVIGNADHYILEVNTAPACSPLTARCYAGEIALMVQAQTSGRVRLATSIVEGELPYDELEDE